MIWKMRKLLTLFLIWAGACAAQKQVLLILHKGTSTLGFYTPEGKLEKEVTVGKHPHEMVVSADRRFAYISDNGTMRVEQPGSGGNTVSVVDLVQRKRVDTIGLGKYRRPHGIDLEDRTGRLVVTTELPDRLMLIDARGRSVKKNLPTEGKTSHMVSFGPGPSGAEWAFVSNSSSATVTAVNLTTGATKVIPSGQRPEGSVLSKDGRQLYVTNRESHAITVIDTERQAVVGEIPTGRGPVRIDITPDGRYLVYALMHDGKVEILDLETRRPVAQIGVDGQPISLHLSDEGTLALAASEEIDTVFVISLAERKVVKIIRTAKGTAPDPAMLISLP